MPLRSTILFVINKKVSWDVRLGHLMAKFACICVYFYVGVCLCCVCESVCMCVYMCACVYVRVRKCTACVHLTILFDC